MKFLETSAVTMLNNAKLTSDDRVYIETATNSRSTSNPVSLNPNVSSCNFCVAKFSEPHSLEWHIRLTHWPAIRIKTLACNYCEAKFSGIQPLKIHKLKHAGEWPPSPPPPPPNDSIPDFSLIKITRPFIANLYSLNF